MEVSWPINLRSTLCIIIRLKLPDGIGRIELLGTCFRSVVVVTEDDKIYFKNRFM